MKYQFRYHVIVKNEKHKYLCFNNKIICDIIAYIIY